MTRNWIFVVIVIWVSFWVVTEALIGSGSASPTPPIDELAGTFI